jgi:hypothetical protein
MSIDTRSTKQPTRPSYTQTSRNQEAAIAFVAVLVSSTLLGSMLRMFDMRSEEAALARAAVKTQPSTDGLAARKVGPGSRG